MGTQSQAEILRGIGENLRESRETAANIKARGTRISGLGRSLLSPAQLRFLSARQAGLKKSRRAGFFFDPEDPEQVEAERRMRAGRKGGTFARPLIGARRRLRSPAGGLLEQDPLFITMRSPPGPLIFR